MTAAALLLLKKYGYTFILPLSIVEGPLLAVACGFLITLNVFNPFLAYGIILLGDLIGDSGVYLLGRFAHKHLVRRFGKLLGVTEDRVESVREQMLLHKYKVLISSKLFHGVGVTGLFTAGATGFPYGPYVTICTAISALQSAFFLLLGILFGRFFLQVGVYLHDYALAVAALAAVVILSLTARRVFSKGK